MGIISKAIWKEILAILSKYKIPYTTHYENKVYPKTSKEIWNKHIQINLEIPDYFQEVNNHD